MLERFEKGRWIGSGRVEVPVHQLVVGELPQRAQPGLGNRFVAPALCEKLGLVNHAGTFDLWDRSGRQATRLPRVRRGRPIRRLQLLYIRRDLLEKYLTLTKQVVVWIPWGERNLHSKLFQHGRRRRGARR